MGQAGCCSPAFILSILAAVRQTHSMHFGPVLAHREPNVGLLHSLKYDPPPKKKTVSRVTFSGLTKQLCGFILSHTYLGLSFIVVLLWCSYFPFFHSPQLRCRERALARPQSHGFAGESWVGAPPFFSPEPAPGVLPVPLGLRLWHVPQDHVAQFLHQQRGVSLHPPFWIVAQQKPCFRNLQTHTHKQSRASPGNKKKVVIVIVQLWLCWWGYDESS